MHRNVLPDEKEPTEALTSGEPEVNDRAAADLSPLLDEGAGREGWEAKAHPRDVPSSSSLPYGAHPTEAPTVFTLFPRTKPSSPLTTDREEINNSLIETKIPHLPIREEETSPVSTASPLTALRLPDHPLLPSELPESLPLPPSDLLDAEPLTRAEVAGLREEMRLLREEVRTLREALQAKPGIGVGKAAEENPSTTEALLAEEPRYHNVKVRLPETLLKQLDTLAQQGASRVDALDSLLNSYVDRWEAGAAWATQADWPQDEERERTIHLRPATWKRLTNLSTKGRTKREVVGSAIIERFQKHDLEGTPTPGNSEN